MDYSVDVDKNWEARFGQGRTVKEFIRKTPAIIAVSYWLFTMFVFFVLRGTGWDVTTDGGLCLLMVTLPWSLVVGAMTSSASSAPAQSLLQSLISPTGMFVLLPVISGELNALTIYGLLMALGRRKKAIRQGPDRP